MVTYLIGCKSLYQLYSRELGDRILKDYKEKQWDPVQNGALAEATRKLQAFEAANPDPTGSDKLIKEDLEARVEMLNTLDKKYANIGPCLDCVVFYDGEHWRYLFFFQIHSFIVASFILKCLFRFNP